MVTKLSVNLNAVAQLRNRRDLPWPSVTGIGRIALNAGAHGLTVHPRPDERHTRRSDVFELRALIDDEFPQAEFNVEGFPDERFIDLVLEVQPEQVTLVPDDPAQATSDHGYDFKNEYNDLQPIVKRLKNAGMRVSIFCDPDASQIPYAVKTGCDRIELYTGPYGGTHDNEKAMVRELEALGEAADAAFEHGLGVNAGHDLVVDNLPPLVARIPKLAEVSIGHGLTADALEHGMTGTVQRFLSACGN